MANKNEIQEYFLELNIEPTEEVINKCLQMCEKYNIDAESLGDQWSAYTASNLNGAPPTLEYLESMERKEFQKDQKSYSKKVVSTPKSAAAVEKNMDLVQNFHGSSENTGSENVILATPKRNRTQASYQSPLQSTRLASESLDKSVLSPCSQSVKYSQRTDSRKVQCFFGPTDSMYKRTMNIPIKISNVDDEHTIKTSTTYMYEVLGKKAQALNVITEWLGQSILDRYGLVRHEGFLKDTMGEMVTYGRIVSDSDGKINEQSIILEGTRETNSGHTINLNVNRLSNYELFPGQVVAVKGNHVGPNLFVADEIFTDAGLELPLEPPVVTEPMQIVLACGPFTFQDELLYEPLNDLLKYVVEYKPHVLLLMGPFLDSGHEGIDTGELMQSFDSHFEYVIKTIMDTLRNVDVQVVVVSSHKDAHHRPIYPTPPYLIREKYPNLTFASDPCLLNVNGLVIGGTTVDTLLDIESFELFWYKSPGYVDRQGRLASHILKQHSFYPLYPPNNGLLVDHEHLEQYGMLDVKPHILILPSNLRYYVKNIEDCLVINPERLTKGHVGGTFARIEIGVGSSNSICNRVSCQILRI